MAFGVTVDGFSIKRLSDVRDEIEASFRSFFGPGINLIPDQFLGQMVGIFAESQAKAWEMGQGVYDAFYPDTASGINLDNVVAITGIKRLEATYSIGTGVAYGTLGTVIPAGSAISVVGNPASRFLTTQEATLAAGTNEVQDIDFSSVPDSGLFTLVYSGEETATLAFNATAGNIQTALNNLPSISGASVSGNFTSGFTVTFTGADGSQSQPTLGIGQNTLLTVAVAVVISIVKTTPGVLPNVSVPIQAELKGAVTGYANSITIIETPVAGWSAFNNLIDVTIGKDIETDAELRLRRKLTLATAGAGTEEAIRARLLEIDEVTDVRVFSNRTMITDVFGRPPKSFEAIIQGGEEDDIKETIWITAPAGIEIYGDITTTIIDSQGFTQTIKYSRPTQIPIYIDITVTVDPAVFPIDGDVAIQEAVANYGDITYSIGDDVIYTQLFCPIHTVQGILGITMTIGIVDPPVGVVNIPIADDEIAFFDTTNITVTVV